MNYYSFTITIPSFKKVYYDGKSQPYGKLTQRQQYNLLEDVFLKHLHPLNFEYIDWVYEEHEDKRLHIHGFTKVNEDKIKNSPTNLLLDDFYSDYRINIKLRSYIKISKIEKTVYDIKFWNTYIQKNQDTIKFRNRYEEEQKLFQNLENGVITPPPKLIDTSVDNYYDTYRFRGKSLIVEF